jgi:pimeloyl-ACP methyl ester carboxylesterase
MDFLYVIVPLFLFCAAILIAWLCLRRIASLRAKDFSTGRKVAERIVLALIAVVALAVGVNSAINALILRHYRAQMPGALYPIDGRNMRLDCTGQGSPTLVLDAGLGNDGLIWSTVQPTLSQTTRVCSYDRAGMGWSDPARGPRDADHIADQLHGLLQAAGVNGPIVLMGHSIAGMYIRDYATRYPQQVAGLIFVDASTPFQNRDPAFSPHFSVSGPPFPQRLLTQALFVSGIARWFGACSESYPQFDPARSKLQAAERCHLVVSSPAGESANFDRSGEETIHTGPYGDLPVLIFSSDPALAARSHEPPDMLAAWTRMQANLKNLSTHSRQIVAANAGHYIQLGRADLINREVPLFIQQIRNSAPPPVPYGSTTTD